MPYAIISVKYDRLRGLYIVKDYSILIWISCEPQSARLFYLEQCQQLMMFPIIRICHMIQFCAERFWNAFRFWVTYELVNMDAEECNKIRRLYIENYGFSRNLPSNMRRRSFETRAEHEFITSGKHDLPETSIYGRLFLMKWPFRCQMSWSVSKFELRIYSADRESEKLSSLERNRAPSETTFSMPIPVFAILSLYLLNQIA